jgi:tetratricopeptide (TPR) repeat protein
MKAIASLLFALIALPIVAQSVPDATERLGTVSFPVSCAPADQAAFNRGVALLHDFWYEEAESQFQQIAKADPGCAMAQWGEAMSVFHEIWQRPSAAAMATGWSEMQKAESLSAGTAREREYIAALAKFYKPGEQDYSVRIDNYSGAMATLYSHYPDDVDAAAFYALSMLAAKKPTDASVAPEEKALAVIQPMIAKYPDHPGLVHYTIHACDNPTLAAKGLEASNHYGVIAATAPHAVHMPGHIYARLGMWQQDIEVNTASVADSQLAESRHQSGAFDQLHADDFLEYAFLQSGQDAQAKALLDTTAALLHHFEDMPGMKAAAAGHAMDGMFAYYQEKLPVFYDLEMRDWQAAAALQPPADATPEVATLTYWARTVADGRIHDAKQARANLATYDGLLAAIRKGSHAYMADSTGEQIERAEMVAWVAYAEAKPEEALKQMRAAADLQDKVGQGEVDIPAREMLADMLLALHEPQQALVEYDAALKLSPNRFNGLFNAGMAAEAIGDKTRAGSYYAALLKSTSNGAQSSRPEFAHVRSFASAAQVASN